MKTTIIRTATGVKDSFVAFTTGQKVTALVGTGALLLASFMVFRWVSQPTYVPLFTGLSGADNAAVVEKLDAAGTQYQLTGDAILVPEKDLNATRISLAGAGLPKGNEGGYAILDKQSLSTSQFQEQTSFKRAMEGELASTIKSIDGVNTAVVHLALPQKQVFADEQSPATASVLVDTAAGGTLTADQVQAIVHLVASSIDSLDPANVTVADQTGTLLSGADDAGGGLSSNRMQDVEGYQSQLNTKVQSILDRVVGPGNGTAQVSATLNFDKTQVQSKTYTKPEGDPKLSSSDQTELYDGIAGANVVGGVVGPDGQMDTLSNGVTGTGGKNPKYEKKSVVSDNAINTVIETSEKAPGRVETLHVGILLDQATSGAVDARALQQTISAAIGIDPRRGDTIAVQVVPFNRTAETAAADELKAAQAAEQKAKQDLMIRYLVIGVLALLALLIMWWRSRRKAKQRQQATNYVVEQLVAARVEPEMPAELPPVPTMPVLEQPQVTEEDLMREELVELVESQPEDVAALLRGWLVERPR